VSIVEALPPIYFVFRACSPAEHHAIDSDVKPLQRCAARDPAVHVTNAKSADIHFSEDHLNIRNRLCSDFGVDNGYLDVGNGYLDVDNGYLDVGEKDGRTANYYRWHERNREWGSNRPAAIPTVMS
jgi:hypothetical protein